MCDKDYGLGGYIGSRMSKLQRKIGLTNKVNKKGDDIIGVQRKNLVRMFATLMLDDVLVATEAEQHVLPLLMEFPTRQTKDQPKDNYVYKDDTKKDVTTIMFVLRAGRNPSSNPETVQILKEVKRSEDRIHKRLAEIEQQLAMAQTPTGDVPRPKVQRANSLGDKLATASSVLAGNGTTTVLKLGGSSSNSLDGTENPSPRSKLTDV